MQEYSPAATAAVGWLYFIIVVFITAIFPIAFAHSCWRTNNMRYSKKYKKYVAKPEPASYKLLASMPFFNIMATYYAFHKKYGWVGVTTPIATLFILLRPIYWFTPPLVELGTYVPAIEWIGFISFHLLVIGLVTMQLTYVIVYVQIASWYRFSKFFYFLLIVVPWVAVAHMVSTIPNQERERKTKSNDRFAENY